MLKRITDFSSDGQEKRERELNSADVAREYTHGLLVSSWRLARWAPFQCVVRDSVMCNSCICRTNAVRPVLAL